MIREIDFVGNGGEWVVQKKGELFPLRHEDSFQLTREGKWTVDTPYPIFRIPDLEGTQSWCDLMDAVHENIGKEGPYMSLFVLQDWVRRNHPFIAKDLTLFRKEAERC
jgi:hypothetical protein